MIERSKANLSSAPVNLRPTACPVLLTIGPSNTRTTCPSWVLTWRRDGEVGATCSMRAGSAARPTVTAGALRGAVLALAATAMVVGPLSVLRNANARTQMSAEVVGEIRVQPILRQLAGFDLCYDLGRVLGRVQPGDAHELRDFRGQLHLGGVRVAGGEDIPRA